MKRFTKAEVRILEHYADIVRHERFCTSLPTIAAATGCSSKTVRRANARFMTLGILSWIRGNGSGPIVRFAHRKGKHAGTNNTDEV